MNDKMRIIRHWYYTVVENAVLEDKTLDTYDKLTYTILCKFADKDDATCFPSYSTLMELVGCSRKRLAKSLATLEEKGWVIRENRQKEEASNIYFLPGKQKRSKETSKEDKFDGFSL